MSTVHIDQCYCFRRTFRELKAVADETGAASVSELQEHMLFGQNCELCHPYVREMLRTGQTVFHQIIRE